MKCTIHDIEFHIPTTEEEFLSGKLHNEIVGIQTHIENFIQCEMKEPSEGHPS